MTDTIAALKARIDVRLNDYLCEMKPGYDDSIEGFNQAWDIVRKAFEEVAAPCHECRGVGFIEIDWRRTSASVKVRRDPFEPPPRCPLCLGSGRLSATQADWFPRGRAHYVRRVACGESAQHCAARLGVTPAELTDMEHGRMDPERLPK